MNTMKCDTDNGAYNKDVQRKTKMLALWTGAWLATTALSVFGPRYLWADNHTLSLVAVIFNILVGFGMIYAVIRHIKSLDELQQKIHMEAMGITLGVTLIMGIAYSTMDTINLISVDAEISYLVMLMGITYFLSVLWCNKRYN